MTRHAWIVVFALAAVPAPAAEPAEGAVVVDLRERNTVGAAVVTVGDVADLRSGPDAVRAAIARLDLADPPTRGTGLTISRRQVEFRLRLAGFPPDTFRLAGATEAGVAIARTAVTAEQVVAAAKDALVRRLPGPAADVAVELVQPVAAKLPEAAVGEEVAIRAEPHAPTVGPGRVQMDVTVSVRGERRLTFPVFLDVKVLQPVVVCTRAVAAGEPLTEANARGERRPGDPARPAPAADAVLGRKAVRAFPAGHAVAAGDVDRPPADPPAVRANQRVTLVVRLGAVNVTAAGEALQDGKVGEAVRVRNADSKKVVTGRVSGPGTVDVELGGTP